jgi:hypothetical protein
MRQLLDRAAVSWAAGALGGFATAVALWAAGAWHLTGHLGVSFAPSLTPAWLYSRIVWGGLWGFLFMLPIARGRWWVRGIILSLAPSAVQLLWVFPHETRAGMLGLGLGMATPVVVLAANAVWGLTAAWLLRMLGRA